MHLASRCSSVFRNAFLASCLLLVGIAGSASAQLPPPSCDYTGPEVVNPGEAFSLCGPEGEGLFWSWHDLDGNLITTDRCLDFPAGLPEEGCYQYEMTVSQGEDYIKCIIEVCVEEKEAPECRISVDEKCDSAELCGPEGFTYVWSGPGVEGATTRCVTVTEDGSYTLEITDPATQLKDECKVDIELKKDCGENCPRTPGYWRQQAEQKGNGSTKFSRAQVIAIAECIDDRVDAFNWGTGETALSNFLATVTAGGGMTCDRQIKRHLAALVANICATGVTPTHGGDVFLDGSTVVSCNGELLTIDELIDEVDGAITGPGDPCDYSDCVDNINNRIGIPLADACGVDEVKDDAVSRVGGSARGFTAGELSFSATNPASKLSVLSFSLPADANVSLKIFDVAGREIADLGGGYTTAGSHSIHWNVAGVARGLYFARLTAGNQVLMRQIAVTN